VSDGSTIGILPISRKVACALEAVLDIAYHGGAEPVRTRDVSERQGIPARYLEQVMQRLVRAGILRGVRGPRGGYLLARERRRIAVGEIVQVVRALDGGAENEKAEQRSALATGVLDPLWTEVQNEMVQHLGGVSIEELCQRAGRVGVQSAAQKPIDFTI
jgi:Rrf2 family protein